MTQTKSKISSQEVRLEVIKKDFAGELSDKIYYECDFCQKMVGLCSETRKLCEKLSGNGFYCPFCLRNGFNTRFNRNILIISFRAIIGYYYHCFYGKNGMYIVNIEEYVSSHYWSGIQNPIFKYDNETYLWFIDFSKVGRKTKKIKLQDVNRTISSILLSFNLWENIPNIKMYKLYEKYSEATEKFHTQRYRPEGKRMCIPTLSGCFQFPYQQTEQLPKGMQLEETRDFMPKELVHKTV